MNASTALSAAPPRAAVWAALALAIAFMLTPDCCLLGHAHGFGIGALGPICHALR